MTTYTRNKHYGQKSSSKRSGIRSTKNPQQGEAIIQAIIALAGIGIEATKGIIHIITKIKRRNK